MNRMRIVLAGPESTAKSALTVELAQRLNVPFALEYARFYLEQHGPAYDYDLLLTLSRKHRAYQREQVPEEAPLGLFDTDLINYKIWCEVAYGRCHPEILAAIEEERHHVYLLCLPDIPWEPDVLREHPNNRAMLYRRHVEELDRLRRPFETVAGTGAARFACAEAAARRLIARWA